MVSVQPAEVDSLRATLAAPEAFREAQIEYPPSSLGLRFNLEKRANGQYYIAVNSSQSVSEPFLDLLVELKWEGGRVLREYTALLDPQGYVPNKPTEAPIVGAKPTPTKPAVRPADGSRSVDTTGPAQSGSKTTAKPTRPAEDTTAGDGEYTVKAGDTLAGIARSHQVEGVSLEQMLVGLYRANMDAFEGKNMNRLKRGKKLKIPTASELSEIPRAAASQEIRIQAEDWRAYRGKLADAAGASSSGDTGGTGKITAKVEDRTPTASSGSPDKLRLSKGDENSKNLQQKIQALEEENAARQKALNEAQQRVTSLQQNIEKMEKLLAMQNQAGNQAQKNAEQARAPLEPKPVEPPKPAGAEPAKPVDPPKSPETPPAGDGAKPVEPPPLPPPQGETPTAPSAETTPPPPTETPPPPKKPKVFVPPPEPEEESLLDNPMVLVGGAMVGLGLLGGGVFFALRRRKKPSFEDSIITGSDLKSNTVVGNTGGAVISTGVTENSFLTDFSREGLGTIDTDEVDPIAEAEVYMAYGRDAQAEEILKDALARDGSRQEVRLKLLEIYNARKNVAAFNQYAQELYTGTQGQGPLWAQAAEMGRLLDPQNPLYQQANPVNTSAMDKTMVMRAGAAAGMIDTAKLNAPLVETPAVATSATDLDFQLDTPQGGDLDFDLGVTPTPAPAPTPRAAEPAPAVDLADDGLDFQIGDLSPTPAPAPDPADAMLSLDIPLDLGVTPAPAAKPLDLGKTPAPTLPKETPVLEEPAFKGGDLDGGLDFNFDLGDTPSPTPAPAPIAVPAVETVDLGGDADVLDFGSELDDPVTTKIDLARAYIDMGDKEGAREILQEAAVEGNSEQKAAAEALLAQL
ncbi:FimV/HubP family polar landmark protein [Chitinimonas lacunae]|uniref:FimV/HubP family polar landmark protein n=1 Tax=Chitinimonas lacunae TaxID=1963018 RepID=A0ABV8MM32_9NEIS